MLYIEDELELCQLNEQSKQESDQWREDYHEFERLADNDLIEDLDPTLPEVNDGTLAASLFKLPKRIVNSKLKGRAKALDSSDAWISELANIQWEKSIIPNANSQAPFHRKWKDAVRKAAIYGSVPLITLFVERGDYIGSDFIVAQPQDVRLEPGKVSDYDSDIFFWDVYYTNQQVRQMIETAKREMAEEAEEKKAWKERKEVYELALVVHQEARALDPSLPQMPPFDEEEPSGYNKWDIEALEEALEQGGGDERENEDDHRSRNEKATKQSGIKFTVIVQRGVEAPFYMMYPKTKKKVRSWTNQDPTGDVPIHFLYCYQDFVNPYGTGIVKLAGGTQNALDYFRQVDILATQLGFRPPVSISGETDGLDLDSIVFEQDAQWMLGRAQVKREEISNQIYAQLPDRMSMYKVSLNQLIPTGDTSISSGSGDQDYSKTPAGVKFQQANLSIDDEDFKDNLYMTFEAKAKSMINIHFANMKGSDFAKLTDDERELLVKSGMDWPVDEAGNPVKSNELEIIWDEVRSRFDFEVEAEQDEATDDATKLEGLTTVAEFIKDPATLQLMASGQPLTLGNRKLDPGELIGEIIALTTKNDKILVEISPEEQEEMSAEAASSEVIPETPEEEQEMVNIQAIMDEHGVPEHIAMAMREAEVQGLELGDIETLKEALMRDMESANV